MKMTDVDNELLEKYKKLSPLEQEKYVERQGVVLLAIREDSDKEGMVLWDVELSHKFQSVIILEQEEGESFDKAASRVISKALKMGMEMVEYDNETEETT
jgi:hypothetical protein